MPDEFKNQIVIGDTRDLAKRVPDESVDIVFTSPPYNVGLDYGVYDDDVPEDEFWQFQAQWMTDAFRVTRDPGRAYVIVSEEMIWRFREVAEKIGWRYHQLLVWCKPNIVNHERISKDWNCFAEWCLLFHKGKRTSMLNEVFGINTHNWIVAATPQSNSNGYKKRVRVAQMSLSVARSWIARTPGNIIYEPFAGCGTTCVAAKLLGRNWIAFEIDPSAVRLARRLVAQAQVPLPQISAIQMNLMAENGEIRPR